MNYTHSSMEQDKENLDSSYNCSIDLSSSNVVVVDKTEILIHVDTVKRCYILYSDKLKKKQSISMYGSLFITIFIAYITSDFKDVYFLTAEIWKSIFCIAGILTFFLSIYFFKQTHNASLTDDDFFKDLINPQK